MFGITDVGSAPSSIVDFVQHLLVGADRPVAVVLCVTPSGMALFDLAPIVLWLSSPLPLNSISEKLGLDHCLCSANESPHFT